MPAKAMETLEASGTDLVSLEEKIYKTIELLKAAREGRAAAEREARRLREQLDSRGEDTEQLRAEVVGLRKEREEIRSRVEKMLNQIDALTAAETEA